MRDTGMVYKINISKKYFGNGNPQYTPQCLAVKQWFCLSNFKHMLKFIVYLLVLSLINLICRDVKMTTP